jgi:alkaline phosphatase D
MLRFTAAKAARRHAPMTQSSRPFPQLPRRSLLKGLAGAGCALAMPAILRISPARAQFTGFPFSLGVASGDPAPDGFVIWTRLAPQPLAHGSGISDSAEVRWEVAADRAMQRVLRSGVVTAQRELGHSVHVEVEGLEPGRDYFYRFSSGGSDSPIGRSRTLPAPEAALSQLRFASAGCQRWQDGYYTAWRRLAEEDFDFVFHYGDYIYEGASTQRERRGRNLPRALPRDFGECATLTDYRRRYALYKSDQDLQAAHASCAFLPSFDDHEVAGNWSADIQPKPRLQAAFLPRRAAAFQAWYENMPVRASMLPRGPDITAYRSFRFGQLADVAVLDTRQYRSRPVCRHLFDSCKQAEDLERTMLGAAQERWLANVMGAAKGTWQVLAQQVLFAPLNWRSFPFHGGNEPELRMDSWDGASAGRNRVLKILQEARSANPVILTGDLHRAMALEISSELTDPPGRCVAVEFLATSISSGGDGRRIVRNADAIVRDNPQLKFVNAERGYTRHTVTPQQWQADFRVLPRISTPGDSAITRKSFVVEAGRPGLLNA